MSLKGKYALITGSSRGIGRAIALKLAECGAKIGVHYYKNIDAANDTLAKVRERRSDGFIVQADVNRTDDIRGMMDHVKSEFGKLDIFVSNARPEIPEFYKPPMEIRVEEWQQAINSQATGTPQDVANATMLICMEESSWMTGQIFYVDGGASIMDTVFPLEIQGAA